MVLLDFFKNEVFLEDAVGQAKACSPSVRAAELSVKVWDIPEAKKNVQIVLSGIKFSV